MDGKKKRGGEAFKRRMLQKMYLVVLQRCDPFTERGRGERGGGANSGVDERSRGSELSCAVANGSAASRA